MLQQREETFYRKMKKNNRCVEWFDMVGNTRNYLYLEMLWDLFIYIPEICSFLLKYFICCTYET